MEYRDFCILIVHKHMQMHLGLCKRSVCNTLKMPIFRVVHKTDFHCSCMMYCDRYVNAALLLAVLSAVAELPKMLSHLEVIPLLSDLNSRK